MTNIKQICAQLIELWDADCYDIDTQINELRAALAEPEPERLTVQEISDLPQHRYNYIAEDCDGKISLDGYFSRADIQQLADSIPSNRSNPNA